MKGKYLLFFIMWLTSCGLFKEVPPHIKEAGRISHAFIDEVSDNSPYEPFGMGGAFNGGVNGIMIEFRTFQNISEAQAEQDIRSMYSQLINAMYEDEKIRPYLPNWPFPEKKTSVGIMFFDSRSGRFKRPPHLASIGIKNGQMYKYVVDPETTGLLTPEEYEQKYGHKFTETLEEGY